MSCWFKNFPILGGSSLNMKLGVELHLIYLINVSMHAYINSKISKSFLKPRFQDIVINVLFNRYY